MGNGIWSSRPETTRGGAPARAFRQETAKGSWNGKTFEPPLTHGRKFTKEELWENYTYFIKQVAPVAEERACGSAFTRTIRRCRSWAACRAASSATSTATCARWKSPTARTSASVSAAAPGWKAARHGQGRLRGDARLRQDGQALEDPFPQRHAPDPGLRRDLRG